MIYKEVFDLRGTEAQQAIVKEALDEIKFPFERIIFPKGKAIIGWANLNTALVVNQFNNPAGPIFHIGDHPTTDTDTESIEGELEGRKYVFGVFYPSSGNIYIDSYLVNYPHYAKTTVSAEIAHGADEFLPLTEEQRGRMIEMLHRGTTGHTDCTWWEKSDYGLEYYNLVGESFMALFTYAYSNMPFDGASSFYHVAYPEMSEETRAIIGIQRTDYVEPIPVIVEPTPPTEQPVEEPAPPVIVVEEPIPTAPEEETTYIKYGKSKIYHLEGHYTKKTNGVIVESIEGMRICKTCAKRLLTK